MKICFPVEKDSGPDSMVYGHFGSAPAFMVFDTETMEKKTLVNNDVHHAHGMCSPLKALSGEHVDAIVVSGIGAGALAGLNRAGIRVYKAFYGSVQENLKAVKIGGLPLFTQAHTCAGHGNCAH